MKRRFWTKDEISYICEFYLEQTAGQIAQKLGRTTAAVHVRASSLGIQKRAKRPAGTGSITSQGYLSFGKGHMQRLAQRIVWEQENGPIPAQHEVHHIDGDKLNNDLSNLQCLSLSEHRRIHSGNWKKEKGQWSRRCTGCKQWKSESEFHRQREPSNSIRPYCKLCSTIRRGIYRDRMRQNERLSKAKLCRV